MFKNIYFRRKHIVWYVIFTCILSLNALELPSEQNAYYKKESGIRTYEIGFEIKFPDRKFNPGKISFIYVPVPPSTYWQKCRIDSAENAELISIQTDFNRNKILKLKPAGNPVKINLTIDSLIHTSKWQTAEFKAPDFSDEAIIFHKMKPSRQFSDKELITEIESFKENYNIDNSNGSVIYPLRKDFVLLYPLSDKQRAEAVNSLSSLLISKNYSARMGSGWIIPGNTDFFRRTFFIEITHPVFGPVVLDKNFNLLSTTGSHILWTFSSVEYPLQFNKAYYSLIETEGEKVLFPSELKVTVKKTASGERPIKKGFFDKYESARFKKFNQKSLFLFQEVPVVSKMTSFYSKKELDLNKAYSWNITEGITLAKGADKKFKPVNPSLEFKASETVYAFISFKNREKNKKVTFQWISPEGKKGTPFNTTAKKGWGSVYSYKTLRNKKQEVGQWLLEIYIDDKLDGGISFTVR